MKELEKILTTTAALSERARREGFLALQDEIEELDDVQLDIFKHGMRLALDGVDSRLIYKILTNMIEREKDANEIRLKTIHREAVLCVQAGYNSRILMLTLFSRCYKNERRVLESKLLRDDIILHDLYEDEEIEDKEIANEEFEDEPERIMQGPEFIEKSAYILKIAYNFAQKARREGLLALEDELEDLDEEFIKEGLRLVVDGTDSGIINTILSNEIDLEKDEKIKRYYYIQKDAVLNIQAGNNPNLIAHTLISHLNNSELKEVSKILKDMEFFKENTFEDIDLLEKDGEKFTELVAGILHRAYKFSDKAKSYAVISLTENIDQSRIPGRDIFEYGIRFAFDGMDKYYIDNILSNLIKLEKNSEIRRAKIIQKEAVLGICGEENPAALFHFLLSFINDEELEEIKKIFSATKFAEKFNELINIPSLGGEDFESAKKNYAERLENSTGSMEVISFFNKPYDLLKNYEEPVIADLLKNEHPQTIASILARLYSGNFCAGGVETVSGILKRVSRTIRKKIIACLEADDPELAEEVKGRMFLFSDLIKMDNDTISKVFKEVDSQELAVALKKTEDELLEKVFSVMSSRAAAMLKEDMEYMGPVRSNRIDEAQRRIAMIVMQMEERGDIII